MYLVVLSTAGVSHVRVTKYYVTPTYIKVQDIDRAWATLIAIIFV